MTNLALINPEHLFVQADALLLQLGRGSLRQADLRRTLSNAYYGLFHSILTAAADAAVARAVRGSPLWTLAYRSISHQRLKSVCDAIQRNSLKPAIKRCEPVGGFGIQVRTIARAVVDLQDRRHAADYDPSLSFVQTDARAAPESARSAVDRLARLPGGQRKAFLYLILFEPRG
ncbi:MAG: hypothetical protein INR70_37155 [Parafilimonas terrae]|nr:hypothetical protein [Parafilimonas terrae]